MAHNSRSNLLAGITLGVNLLLTLKDDFIGGKKKLKREKHKRIKMKQNMFIQRTQITS